MGYFANSTEGTDYEKRWCRRCMHGDGDSAGECAVWEAHLLCNYEQAKAGVTREPTNPLHVLIPVTGIENERCRMFISGAQRRLF